VATGNDRDYRLNVFNGRPANGSWQLYVTDLSSGGQMRLDTWSLSLTGDNQVPEASTWVAGAALLGLAAWRRWRSR
jgi:subtilisin-like proprotein convertase family protein